ncbi:regulator of G-protein signaling 21-like [Lampris incognitus]|uniref:regulator of G-protein signaling 21-like n=1 Tax=Lampris incognitus TaxID=2546036 RepID=UPI0024B59D11|nr:regulator of G-protein signaling 21-like [Lampris incognitus]
MSEKLLLMSSTNMASTDCVKAPGLSAGKPGIRRGNLRMRLRLFLKMGFSQAKPKVKKNRSYRPTADDVSQWAQSLDKLLGHKYGKAAFAVFLKSEFCEENIEFWSACEDFRGSASKKELSAKASSIYEDFIKSAAPKEINLDFHTKNTIVQSLGEPDVSSFLAAQKKVYTLMENDSYPRFINSDLYKELCAAAKKRANTVAPGQPTLAL